MTNILIGALLVVVLLVVGIGLILRNSRKKRELLKTIIKDEADKHLGV